MILITGATGFLGRHLVSHLLGAGYPLRLLVRDIQRSDIPEKDRVSLAEGDILDPLSLVKAMEGVEQIVHAAAVVTFAKNRYPEMKAVNVEGTANVVNAALQVGVKRLVHISSTSATGRIGKGETVDEAMPWQPGKHHSYYGVTKHLAEMEVHRGVAEGLPAIMLNPSTIIGPGDWTKGTPKLFTMVYKGLRFYLPSWSGFVGVNDVCKAVEIALHSEHEQAERFLLVSESLPQKEFLAMVAKSMGKKAPTIAFPPRLGQALGWVSERIAAIRGKEPLITVASMKQVRRRVRYDASKATRELGIEFEPMEEVIEKTGAAFLNNNHG